jgi:catechol 2,3-dioxygenase-like lactoylglutathione lyase family enzyme
VTLGPATPQLFVTDIERALGWYVAALGFRIVFRTGEPAFYAQVARDAAVLNLRHVDAMPPPLPIEEPLAAAILVDDIDGFVAGCAVAGPIREQPWGARDCLVTDPDGNLLLFAGR